MLQSFWDKIINQVQEEHKRNNILISVVSDSLPVELKENSLVVAVASVGAKDYLEKKKSLIEKYVSFHAGKKTSVEFVIKTKTSKKKENPLLDFEPTREELYRSSGLNPMLTFENFAVSSTNQVAFAAAQAVSRSPAKSYNPLFFYGGVGVGKTHLAQAIARVVLDKQEKNSVYFCSSEKFMNELIESIRGKTTARFRKKYRSLDLIIIDDVQFIAGKQTVQEEFFHTFNSIVAGGGQIILTSDKPPGEIKNLEDRLRSRFSGGLIVDIQQPDFELRTAIILIKAKEKNISINIDSAKIIADNVKDTRSLEGTLLSLYARTLSTESNSIDLFVVESFFNKEREVLKKRISPQDIIKAVCSFYQISQSQIKGKTRKRKIAEARQIAMFLLRQELDLNLEEVAFLVKRKDHTTVLHAVNKIREKVMKDQEFKNEVEMISSSLK